MSEALLGVLIGGLIGSIAPFSTLCFNHLHWKREAKLVHLKTERARLEQLFEKNIARLGEAMEKNNYPSEMSADFAVLMSKEISELYNNFMGGRDQSEQACKIAYLEIAIAMKHSLKLVDKKIDDLVS